MWIDANFDCGNIDVVSDDDPSNIRLKIKRDAGSTHAQWFYFRVLGAAGKKCFFNIINAGDASYPEAWPNGSIVVSNDRKFWQRQATSFDGATLSFEITCEAETLYVALSPPFTDDQHQSHIGRALSSKFCRLNAVIPTIKGRPIELLQIGDISTQLRRVWIIARQHPGEPMAEWYIEGLLDRLLDPKNDVAKRLRRACSFFIVPNMNPDGSTAGHLRTNAAGVDLNRAWALPSVDTSPEVHGVLGVMEQFGVDVFLDIHGDEELELVFAAGCEGNPSYTKRLADADQRFRALYHKANPDFSTESGYVPDAPGAADLSIACNQVGERFGCLSLTIEIPFKDNAKKRDPIEGWSAPRSKALGASVLTALADFFGI